MDTTEFSLLTEAALAELLAAREAPTKNASTEERRASPRWPFPGTVELWVTDADGLDELRFATCLNLSPQGVGITADFELEPGQELALTLHEPEVSLQGRAVVRHCNEIETGYYLGLQFLFDTEAEKVSG